MSRVTNAIITAHVGPQGHSDPEIDSVNRFLRGTDGGGGGEFMPRDLRQCPFAQHPPAPAAPTGQGVFGEINPNVPGRDIVHIKKFVGAMFCSTTCEVLVRVVEQQLSTRFIAAALPRRNLAHQL